MKNTNIEFNAILSALIFTVLYTIGGYFLISIVPGLVYQIIISFCLVIFYANFLRLFAFEILSVKKTSISELLNYFLMYVITGVILAVPFFVDPIYLYESKVIRYVIIFFASLMLLKYFFYMVLSPLQDVLHEFLHARDYGDKEYNPKVSVVIPAWNEEVGILSTISSLLESTYKNMEIVVVNDGSTDSSDEMIRDFMKNDPVAKTSDIKIVYEYQENGGKGEALNKAISISTGEIIVSIDADCIVDRDAIGEFVEEFKNPSVMAAVGNVKIGNSDSTIGLVQHLEFLFSFYFKRAESLMGAIYIIGGAAGAFRRDVFDKVGLYNTSNITEDIELTVRIQEAGMKIAYVPKALVYTEGASDLKSLKSQRLRWKRGRFETFLQYRHLFFSTEKHHNKFLTFLVMPIALLQELHLLLEIPFLIFLYSFSILNNDYLSYVIGVLIVGAMFVVQFLFFDKSTRKLSFVALAPIGWLMFYIATYVEAYSLLKTIGLYITGKELKWQKWERKGMVNAYSS